MTPRLADLLAPPAQELERQRHPGRQRSAGEQLAVAIDSTTEAPAKAPRERDKSAKSPAQPAAPAADPLLLSMGARVDQPVPPRETPAPPEPQKPPQNIPENIPENFWEGLI